MQKNKATFAVCIAAIFFLTLSKTYANVETESLLAINDRDVILGNKNSPVTLIEYGDYQCPFCLRMFSETELRLRDDFYVYHMVFQY